MIEQLRKYFQDMMVFKAASQGKFFSTLGLPSFMRDWLLMKFSDNDGVIDKEEVSKYVKKVIPQKGDWEKLKLEMSRNYESVKFLAKIKVTTEVATKTALFSLPDFAFPNKKNEAIVDWTVLEKNKQFMLTPNDVWGIVELVWEENTNKDIKIKYVIKMVDFKPFCPYEVDLQYFTDARYNFNITEWIDILLSAIDYNPDGYVSDTEKLTMLSRLLPFVEPRLNLIELAPKGTGKSYLFSQISKYGWLVSGGSISRASLFYDRAKKAPGLISFYDYVALDEVQSISFPDKLEMQGVLKDYLESGEFRIGDFKGVNTCGMMILGNIDEELMDVNMNMFENLDNLFDDSALLDRFHGLIKGWDIPRMKENLKVNGWALNVEYYTEILHLMRTETIYRAVVDELLTIPKDADTRDVEAVKRVATGFLKLLFPHIKSASQIDKGDFDKYCLQPAIEMRGIIKKQLGIKSQQFRGKEMPDIRIKECI